MAIKRIVAVIVFTLALPGRSYPIYSMLGADKCEILAEETDENLWVWPMEAVSMTWGNPSAVRYIVTGLWYIRIAHNGYCNTPIEGFDFTGDSFHNNNTGGYSMVQFFALEQGEYNLSYDYMCETASDNATVWVNKYIPSGQGFVYNGAINISLLTRETLAGHKSETYGMSIPQGVLTCICITGYNQSGRRSIDVWNVTLQKVN